MANPPPELRTLINHSNDCPHCNGTGEKRWGNLGVRKCVKCKGTGKKREERK